MSKIMIDDYGYEIYDNLTAACEAWHQRAADVNAYVDTALDYTCNFESGTSDLILFDIESGISKYGLEGITDKVKNMASRASSNIVLIAKKFINFFFGWIIDFFKGAVNIRKSIKAAYGKSKTYLKELEKMTSKLGKAEDEKIEVRNHGDNAIKTLGLVLTSSFIFNMLSDDFAELEKISAEGNDASNIAIDSLKILTFACLGISSMTIMSQTDEMVKAMIDTPISKIFENKLNPNFNNNSVNISDSSKTIIGRMIEAFKKLISSQNKLMDILKDTKDDDTDVEGLKKDAVAILTKSSEKIKSPDTKELSLGDAYSYFKMSLTNFNKLCENNKDYWNFEKIYSKIEKSHKKVLTAVDKLNNENDENVKDLFQRILKMGNLFSSTSKNMKEVMGKTNQIIDDLITDTAKLGSKLVKI